MKYKCILGVKLGDAVHKPGEIIDLTDAEARVCLERRAVEPAPTAVAIPTQTTAPSPAPVAPKPAELVQEAAKLVAQAEAEVGAKGTDAE